MGGRVNYGGIVIAVVGFFLTRFTVTLALYDDPVRFYLAGVVPLALGLGLAAFGVALAVADVDTAVVRTTASWCLVGTGAMFVLVTLTLLGSTTGDLPDLASVRSRAYLSNLLLGGSVGGTLTGLYASRSRQRREELRRQTHRLEVLNRLLRHDVLNAVTVIRGYATLDTTEHPSATGVIEERSADIERTIDAVRYLTRNTRRVRASGDTVDPCRCLVESVETVRARHPDARISVALDAEDPRVRATPRLRHVFVNLLENAVVHGSGSDRSVEVSLSTTATSVCVSVRDHGPGLPAPQQALLETGDIGEFDDPRSGFGLNVVRLLVESYDGTVTVETGETGTAVTVGLRRADVADAGLGALTTGASVRPALPHLAVTLVAALLAGVLYSVASGLQGGSVAAIGVFYGVENVVVGWYTHQFHSVVFAFGFAGLVSLLPPRYRDHLPTYAAVGLAWGLFIWAVAASVVAPVWLRLLGIPAPVPNVSLPLLASHLVWGGSLGALTAWGYAHATPWLARVGQRVTGRFARA